jgi:Mrp family chromosome partitioning ATPase
VARRNEAPAQQGQQGRQETAGAAVPEERQRVADQVAAAGAPAADAALEKTEVAVQGAPAAAPPPPPAAKAAPAVGQATGGKGGAAGARTAANAAAALLRNEAADAAAPFSFAYRREADALRIVPAAQGFLVVSAGGQPLFPQNAVLAGSNVIVPLPAGIGDITIVFAASADAPSAEAVRRDAATGTVTDPNPSPNSRLAVIVPALP